jgi:hypothetical protein
MVRAGVLLLGFLLIGAAVGFPAPYSGDGVRPAKAQDWPAKAGKKKKGAGEAKKGRKGSEEPDHEGGGCRSFARAQKCMARKSVRFRSCECIGQ